MKEVYKTHGAFSWCELMTSDASAAKAFYAELFGWQFKEYDMTGDGNPYHVCATAGDNIEEGGGQGGIMKTPPNLPPETPPFWTPYVTVDDVDATAKKAEELGATILMPCMDIPTVGRMCWIKDPQGAVIAFIKYSMAEDC